MMLHLSKHMLTYTVYQQMNIIQSDFAAAFQCRILRKWMKSNMFPTIFTEK